MIRCTLGLSVLLLSLGAACGSEAGVPTGSAGGGGGVGSSGSSGENGGAAGGSSAGGGTRANGGNPTGGPSELAAGGVNLGSAGNYVVLSKSGISTVPSSVITGNLGISP